MSELLISPVKPEIVMPSTKELLYLAALALADTVHFDLDHAKVERHRHFFTHNPNAINHKRLLDSGELKTEAGIVYRPLSLSGLTDLIKARVVRNELSARAHTPRLRGNAVYWIEGSDNGFINIGEQVVIATKAEELKNGWITPDKLTSIYAETAKGVTEDLLS